MAPPELVKVKRAPMLLVTETLGTLTQLVGFIEGLNCNWYVSPAMEAIVKTTLVPKESGSMEQI